MPSAWTLKAERARVQETGLKQPASRADEGKVSIHVELAAGAASAIAEAAQHTAAQPSVVAALTLVLASLLVLSRRG